MNDPELSFLTQAVLPMIALTMMFLMSTSASRKMAQLHGAIRTENRRGSLGSSPSHTSYATSRHTRANSKQNLYP